MNLQIFKPMTTHLTFAQVCLLVLNATQVTTHLPMLSKYVLSENLVMLVALPVSLLCCAGLLVACGRMDPQQRFLSQYQAAHAAKDIDRLLEFYCWEGVTPEYRRLVRVIVHTELDHPIASVLIEPLNSGDDFIRNEYAGDIYEPNLEPVCKLQVVYAIPERLHSTYLLGLDEDHYKIINPRPLFDRSAASIAYEY